MMRRFLSAMGQNRSFAENRLLLTAKHLRPEQWSRLLSQYASAQVGLRFSSSYKNYAVQSDENKIVSYFHDIPLSLDMEKRTVNMVVEVPRWSNAKFEISTSLEGNPIVQDTKNGKVRFVRNLFPYHGYIHNYGALLQTWEDPTVKSNVDGLVGDGDPLDVCEIGSRVWPTGSVRQVRVLGSLALVDDGELDWKVIAIDTEDPLADELFDVHDVFVKCPGLLEATRQWFKDYKIPDGKPQNRFALGGKYRTLQETIETIVECQEAWKRLVNGETKPSGDFSTANVGVPDSEGHVLRFSFNDSVLGAVCEPDTPIPAEVDKPFYVVT